MIFLAPLAAVAMLAGCETCDRAGYTPLRVQLVQGAPAVAGFPGGCAVYADLGEPLKLDQRHVGASVYGCLTGTAPVTTAEPAGGAAYDETLWFRIDGQCPERDGFTYYGCFSYQCRTVNAELAHIGPEERCPHGTPQAEWTDACWTQFYRVIGHEVMHAWLGEFHAED